MHYLCLFAAGRLLQNMCKFKHTGAEKVLKSERQKPSFSLHITNVVTLHGGIILIGEIHNFVLHFTIKEKNL